MSSASGIINLKITLLGDGYVGKTSLRLRYLGQGFETEYLGTLGADFAVRNSIFKGRKMRYQIWDIAGQKSFKKIREAFYLGSQAALILFDITNQKSLENVNNWIQELWEHNGKGKIPILIIGNKIDLRDTWDNPLLPEDGKTVANEFSKEAGFTVPYLETSAKTGENVDEAFEKVTEMFYEHYGLLKNSRKK